MEKNGNGHISLRSFFIFIGILIPIFLALASFFTSRTNTIEAKIDDIAEFKMDYGSRISVLETDGKNIERRLTNIETKLDKLLEAWKIK